MWALEMYRQHLASLLERGMEASALLTELEKLDYLSRFYRYYNMRVRFALAVVR